MAEEAQPDAEPTPGVAAAILASGFRDGAGTYGVSRETEGGCLSDLR